jgi:hypothetical protein
LKDWGFVTFNIQAKINSIFSFYGYKGKVFKQLKHQNIQWREITEIAKLENLLKNSLIKEA